MWWRIGAVMGALAVALGAFGAHGLKNVVLDPHLLEVWGTAARYHLLHAVVVLVVGSRPRPAGWRGVLPGTLFVVGTVLFSGSLYLMTLTGLRWLGAITPLGGLCLIAGWLSLAVVGPDKGAGI